MSVRRRIPDIPVDYINRLAILGMVYDGSPPIRRVVVVEARSDGLAVTYEGSSTRPVGCNDYFIVELRRLRRLERDVRKKVELALNALADRHMLYVDPGFKKEVFIITLTKDFMYIISRDENGAYQHVITPNCLSYLFIKVAPHGC
jgi:hypothetical protein